MKSLSIFFVVALAVHLTVGGDVDLDRLRAFLQQRALNSPRYVGQPPANSKPAPLAPEEVVEEQAAPADIYQYNFQAPSEEVGRAFESPDEEEQSYQGPLAQEELIEEQSEPVIEDERNYEEPRQEEEPNMPYNAEEMGRAFEEPQGVDQLMEQERYLAESQREQREEQEFVAQQAAMEDVEQDEQMLAAVEIRGVNEQLDADAAEAIQQRAEAGDKKDEDASRKNADRKKTKNKSAENKERWALFKKLKVTAAETYERSGPDDDFKKYAVVVTVEDGTRYFIRNSRFYVQVVNASYLSDAWKQTAAKKIASATVGDYMAQCKAGTNAFDSIARMWKLA